MKDIGKLEDQERERRVAGDEEAKANANLVAYLIDSMHNYPLKRGTPGYSLFLEEKERKRRLKVSADDSGPRIHARAVAELVKQANIPKITRRNRGAYKYTRNLEERERTRRLADKHEAISRRMKSLKVADEIRLRGAIIKARLKARTPSAGATAEAPTEMYYAQLESFAFSAARIAYKAGYIAYSALAPVVVLFLKLIICAAVAAGGLVEANFPTVISQARSSPLWSKLVPTIDLETVKIMEEDEKFRRILEDPVDGIAEANARRVARLIQNTQTNRSLRPSGFLKFITQAEEAERRRRMADKEGAMQASANALKVSDVVRELVWSKNKFFKPEGKQSDDTRLLVEEERKRRMAEDSFTNRWNARNVAFMIHEVFSPVQDDVFAHAYTRSLEEAERAHRVADPSSAIQVAHSVADLVSSSPFFVGERTDRKVLNIPSASPTTPNSANGLTQSMARRFSLLSPSKEDEPYEPKCEPIKLFRNIQIAQEHAENISHMINQDVNLLQENERESRMADKIWQQQSRDNALKVSDIIKSHFSQKVNDRALPLDQIHNDTPTPAHYFSENTEKPAMLSHGQLTRPPKAFPIPASPITNYGTPKHMEMMSPPEHVPFPLVPPNTPIEIEDSKKTATSFSVESRRLFPQEGVLSSSPPTIATRGSISSEEIHHSPLARANTVLPIITTYPHSEPQGEVKKPRKLRSTFSKRLSKEYPQEANGNEIQLLQHVRRLYQQELKLAEREIAKVEKLRQKKNTKKGMFGDFRLQRHESLALKHQNAAQMHKTYIDAKESILASTPAN